ncbi:GH1 family beta-glucosidase [Phytoactinopolyspora limicola]|uniref:GH1 family beta-glucosidase n=1 Tax=Phytoactinopolyspora limicola TaxID=2715536 RepID=UPI001B7D8CB7|nr:GH1 family beta-glucosidase [Phytoactinopolyspora limicola]
MSTQATSHTSPDMAAPVTFPPGFVWGAATAAYQIEGAATVDGRGASIWDTFSHTPGAVHDGDTGDTACDHYHRYPDDVALMARLGLGAYRFSIAWPRIQPRGSGPANPAGLDFYDRLVDSLFGHGIEPIVTLYHWDLPQALEDDGGWATRDTAYRFAEYAALVHERLGDRVHRWITLNEPWCAAFLGYASGIHAPGRTDPAAAFAAAHHLLLGHGLAVRSLRDAGAGEIGITLNPAAVRPADPSAEDDAAAARTIDGLHNRIFLDPLFGRGYPADVVDVVRRFTDPAWMQPGDDDIIAAPLDLLGVNYYTPTVVAARAGTPPSAVYPGSDGIEFQAVPGPVTAMGWPIEPASFTTLLTRLAADYSGVPIWITENGAAFDDHHDPATDRVADPDRIHYLDGHLRAVHAALSAGVDVRGYLVWSLLDNFEWAEGYRKRFGIVFVHYPTQNRVPKDSARWYQAVINRGGLPGAP